ncbi:FAD-dependent oxidoreductase [Pseudoclavibacter chungangensis]|uniref:FAD-dependent oxidoreductase n=1 Tax=Pseudoclavibacter chungangensis TaxID=587635 RepID=A0A7J5C2P3_9MICO|nr:FAD-dependent oxidoreductase [Pseudoclavibacter chungangensis]KAB1662462.1 FAD-dependent oxidoreductase [Pseudoclavibacter chungangensis]NYJ68495.1 glycine/D-amino acid oxidase-like deaminating enzyme [Pseudoclavibacter chungangensis]
MLSYDRAERDIPIERVRASLAGASPTPYWLDDPRRPAALPALAADVTTDLAVVGGGYTGLWTALMAKERDPGRRVVLLEGNRIAWAASGRNGGFCETSLTHGESNGRTRLPDEVDLLDELGARNVREMVETIARYGMDCEWDPVGVLTVATEPHQIDWLREEAAETPGTTFLDGPAVRAEVDSPLYLEGLRDPGDGAMVSPAHLAWELRRVCLELGVEIFEHTPVRKLHADEHVIRLETDGGTVHATDVALGTNVFPALLPAARLYTIPVYDYALMTEPLSDEQLASIGWAGRYGISDLNNRFHYSRLTRDHEGRTRILYGGYDPVYHFGGRIKRSYDQRPETFEKLAAHFAATYPQLDGLRFSHAWGGAIDTCSRFFSFFATAHRGRVTHAAGFTGLGVGATRFAANVMLDLLSGEETERTRLELVRTKPIPFPPEPFASIGAGISLAEMARADRNEGRRGLWLKTMDAVGLGFDS